MVSTTIRVEGLGKSYRIGGVRQAPRTSMRDAVASAVLRPLRRTGKLLRGQAYGAAELDETIWAIKDVSFSVEQGEVLGIIGRNGAGKTTLLRILSRITDPTEGSVELLGRVGALLEVGTGFHAELTGRENTYLNGAILGMKRSEIQRKFDEIVDFSGVEKFIDTPVKHYSTGMQVRLAFAVAAHLEPDILLVDEVLATGDYEFQRKCLGKMGDIGREGRTVLLVSHQLNNIAGLCSRCILLEDGQIAMEGETSRVLTHYVATVRRSAGEVVWDDPQSAPGNEKLRLHAVRILDSDGQVSPDLDIQGEIVLKVSYWNLKDGISPNDLTPKK